MVEATNTKFILTNYKFEWSAVPSSVTPISYPYEGLEWRYIFPTCEQAYSVKVTASFVYEHKEIKNSINVHVPIHYDGCRVNSSYAV
jgi:hypothetical protein